MEKEATKSFVIGLVIGILVIAAIAVTCINKSKNGFNTAIIKRYDGEWTLDIKSFSQNNGFVYIVTTDDDEYLIDRHSIILKKGE